MADPPLSVTGRAAVRRHLRASYPWIDDPDLGPRTVTAGECDLCGDEARLVQPCGPAPEVLGTEAHPDWALGRRCAAQAGPGGWCDGHHDEAAQILERLAALPEEADQVTRLWWLATGEVRPDPALVRQALSLLPTPWAEGDDRSPVASSRAHVTDG